MSVCACVCANTEHMWVYVRKCDTRCTDEGTNSKLCFCVCLRDRKIQIKTQKDSMYRPKYKNETLIYRCVCACACVCPRTATFGRQKDRKHCCGEQEQRC